MKIFFGKIKPSPDNKQIKEAYYETLSPMKLGELQTGDYAFIISGKDVHLWLAKERVDIDGHPKMNFEVIQNNLPLTSQKFVAFKYFKLDSSLIVLTIRQSPKAFYPIHLAIPSLTEEMLRDRSTYENEDNFREIRVLKSISEVVEDSTDIQLYFTENKMLKVVEADFFEQRLFPDFVDNLSKAGNGRKMKDSALRKIQEGATASITYPYNHLPILRMYDALFNDYGSPEEVETIETEDEPEIGSNPPTSLELKSYNQIYYGPPGTGKTYLVRKNFCLEEDVAASSARERKKLDAGRNFWHLAPGRNGYLWDDLKKGNVLGYEWVDKSWEDIRELTPKHIEEEGWGSYQLITYLREVKKGDYICIISGRRLLGIAEVTEPYDYPSSTQNNFAFQTIPVKWLRQFEHPLYLNSSQTKTFVRLNYGTRWSSLLTLLRENGFYFDDNEISEHKAVRPKNFSFITFHQSFSYEDFIEGIKPVLPDTNEDEPSETVQYEIVPGIFYQACEKAAQLAGYDSLQDSLADNKVNRQRAFNKEGLLEYYLIIDELNRGNVAAIFGELITLIEDDKRLGTTTEITTILPYSKSLFGIPANLRIIGTMNTADRSIEALDTALRRRFSFEEILPDPMELRTIVEGLSVDLRKLLEIINGRLEKLLDRDHTIGHAFFMRVENTDQLRKVFCNKIIPLLQEYFYHDYAKIGLIIGMPFLNINMEKSVFMRVDHYDSSSLEDRMIYSLKNLDTLTDEAFLAAIRNIYEGA